MTTIHPRAIRALREARARMRDAAAASHASASATEGARRAALAQEQGRLDAHLDAAGAALAAARTIYDLDAVGERTGDHRRALDDAGARHAEAAAAAEAATRELRARAQKLRTAERIAERVADDHDRREARAEQRANDDLSGRRR